MTPDASEMARLLASRRRRATFVCEVCGATFGGLDRPTQQPRTCSPKCRQRLWRDSNRQKATEAAPGH